MKLQKRLKQTLAMTAVATTLFSAVPAFAADYTGHWAETTINEWKDKGVIDGYEDGSFKPKQEVTRAELAKMLVEVFGLTYTEGAEKFFDVAGASWYAKHVSLVSAAGLMVGTEGNFRPNDPATREEAAYAIATAYHITGETTTKFKDHADISEFAVEEVEALVAGGYLNGYPDGTFKPQGTLTRAEAVTMLDKITADIYSTKGTYTEDTKGNLVINTTGVELKDMTVNGNLYLAEGIGEGEVRLNGVTVTGAVIVEGGGPNSVHIEGESNIPVILVDKAKGDVRIKVAKESKVGTLTAASFARIEGAVDTVKVVSKAGITLGEDSKVKTLEVAESAKDAKITLEKGSVVEKATLKTVAELTGKGKVTTVVITVTGDDLKSIKIHVSFGKIENTEGKDIASSVNTTPPTTSGGGGGGGGRPPVVTEKPVEVTTVRVKTNEALSKEISVKDNAIEVEVGTDKVTIEGVPFDKEYEVYGVEILANVGEKQNITITPPVASKYSKEIQTNEIYTVKEMQDFVALQAGEIEAFLTDAGISKETVANVLDVLGITPGQGIVGDTVTVGTILEKVAILKEKVNVVGGTAEQILNNKEVKAALKLIGFELTGTPGNYSGVQFKIKLSPATTGYDSNTYTFTVQF